MKIDKPGQHLDHMLRATRWHHVQLSGMADMKANILLTMSAVVITLAAPHVFKEDSQWPFMVLIGFCLVTVGLAAYAVMPKFSFPATPNSRPDVHSPQFNLLFFGDFIRLSYPEYEAAMEEMMNDPDQVYRAQLREIYLLGTFLARKKYRFLRLAYLSFILGFVACFILALCSAVMP
jgi:hypothetical protein